MAVRIVLRHLAGSQANRTQTFDVDGPFDLVAGRDPACPVRFDAERDDLVSRRHLRIAGQGNTFTLTDLGSRNGTFVNRQRIFSPVRLSPGDVVQLGTGGPEFRFEIEQQPAMAPQAEVRRRPHVKVAPVLIALTALAALAAGWVYRTRLGEWAGAAWAYRLQVASWAMSLVPHSPPPPPPSKWALAEARTGTVLFGACAPNAGVQGAAATLPVFVLLPDGRILPVLTAAPDAASRPTTIVASGSSPPDWRAVWRRDAAGWLLVVDWSLNVRQSAPLSTGQFPAWKPAEGALVLVGPLDARHLEGKIEPIGGKRLA